MAILEYHVRLARARVVVSTTTLEASRGAFTESVVLRQMTVLIVGGLALAKLGV